MQASAICDKTQQFKSLVPNSQPPQGPSEVVSEYEYLGEHRSRIGRLMGMEAFFSHGRYAKAARCSVATIERAYREPWRLTLPMFVEIVRVHLNFHPTSQIALILKGRR